MALLISACSGAAAPAATVAATAATTAAPSTGKPAAATAVAAHPHDAHTAHTAHATAKAKAKLPKMVVHKSPTCGCCSLWVEHVRAAGFEVEVRDREDLSAIKQRLGVPYGKGSCHTAEVGGYFVEGHVPVGDIQRMLKERPQARGLTVPGMPAGSPGMEMPDGRTQAYAVELVTADGGVSVYARH
ncbi:DUF411 domain-containing protein [Lysobacter sp. 5GHs7-4]|uniref:DUF411 domain-containing protein n=1 Tax=Lysobacter sp. 5GHs7-4 TaxID=2904253 RepID=UPI001E60DAEA|nr:DUF411 domain-containing protein [Lysobacter sp. 5GHs7-4]UHQ21428.1 DUF411 domain-containing protein [Lysobacter sp. 5GHs7-4]